MSAFCQHFEIQTCILFIYSVSKKLIEPVVPNGVLRQMGSEHTCPANSDNPLCCPDNGALSEQHKGLSELAGHVWLRAVGEHCWRQPQKTVDESTVISNLYLIFSFKKFLSSWRPRVIGYSISIFAPNSSKCAKQKTFVLAHIWLISSILLQREIYGITEICCIFQLNHYSNFPLHIIC